MPPVVQQIIFSILGDADKFRAEAAKADAAAGGIAAKLRQATEEEKKMAAEARVTAEAFKKADKAAFDLKVKLEQARVQNERLNGSLKGTVQQIGNLGTGLLGFVGKIGLAISAAKELHGAFQAFNKFLVENGLAPKDHFGEAYARSNAERAIAAARANAARAGGRAGSAQGVADVMGRVNATNDLMGRLQGMQGFTAGYGGVARGQTTGALLRAITGDATDIGGNRGGALIGGLSGRDGSGRGAGGSDNGGLDLRMIGYRGGEIANDVGSVFSNIGQTIGGSFSMSNGGAGNAAGLFGGGGAANLLDRAKQVEEFGKKIQDVSTASGAAFGALSSGLAAAVEAAVNGGDSIGRAFLKAAAAQLKSTAVQSSVLALFETAKGFAALAVGSPTASAHFKSAAVFGATALAAGVAGAGLGSLAGGGGQASGGGFSSGSPSASNLSRPSSSGGGGGGQTIIIHVNGVMGDAAQVGAQVSKAVETGLRSGLARDRTQKTVRFA